MSDEQQEQEQQPPQSIHYPRGHRDTVAVLSQRVADGLAQDGTKAERVRRLKEERQHKPREL